MPKPAEKRVFTRWELKIKQSVYVEQKNHILRHFSPWKFLLLTEYPYLFHFFRPYFTHLFRFFEAKITHLFRFFEAKITHLFHFSVWAE